MLWDWFKRTTRSTDAFASAYFRNALNRLAMLRSVPPRRSIFDSYDVLEDIVTDRVFLVRRQRDNELLVVKIIADHRMQSSLRHALLEEARWMLHLSSASLLSLDTVEADTRDGHAAIVTPYCAGGSLRQRLLSGKCAAAEALHHLLSMLCAIMELHEKNVIHGDIKPENVLFYYDSAPEFLKWTTVISDLGLASLDGESLRSGLTKMYAAPEVLRGSKRDKPEDMWAWAIVAWELLGGHHPYEHLEQEHPSASNSEIAAVILQFVQAHRAQLPEHWLGQIVSQCLATDPHQRPTAREVMQIFQRHVAYADDEGSRIGPKEATLRLALHNVPVRFAELQEKTPNLLQVSNTLDFPGRWKKAEDLLRVGTQRAAADAVKLIDGMLGDIDDTQSFANQLIRRPRLESLPIPMIAVDPDNDFLEFLKREEFSRTPRQLLLDSLGTGIQAIVQLIEQHHFISQPLVKVVSSWIRIFTELTDELTPAQLCLGSQLCLFWGRFTEVEVMLERALRTAGDHELLAAAIRHELLVATQRRREAVLVAKELIGGCTRRNLSQLVINWRFNYCINMLYVGEQLDLVAYVLDVLPQHMTLTGLIRLVLLRRTGAEQDRESWKKLQLDAQRKSSPGKTWLALECMWEYGERETARQMAGHLLTEPRLQLPFYNGYRMDLMRLMLGAPWFSLAGPDYEQS